MPEYHFTGAYPRVLAGLSQGVNATLLTDVGHEPPHGSTIEAHPGDTIHTDDTYAHPELEEVTEQPQPPAAEPAAPAEPVVPIQLVAADTPAPADPDHDAMTAEGAPAPAATTA